MILASNRHDLDSATLPTMPSPHHPLIFHDPCPRPTAPLRDTAADPPSSNPPHSRYSRPGPNLPYRDTPLDPPLPANPSHCKCPRPPLHDTYPRPPLPPQPTVYTSSPTTLTPYPPPPPTTPTPSPATSRHAPRPALAHDSRPSPALARHFATLTSTLRDTPRTTLSPTRVPSPHSATLPSDPLSPAAPRPQRTRPRPPLHNTPTTLTPSPATSRHSPRNTPSPASPRHALTRHSALHTSTRHRPTLPTTHAHNLRLHFPVCSCDVWSVHRSCDSGTDTVSLQGTLPCWSTLHTACMACIQPPIMYKSIECR